MNGILPKKSTISTLLLTSIFTLAPLSALNTANAQESDKEPNSDQPTEQTANSSKDGERSEIALFSKGQTEGWEEKSFKGKTHYRLDEDDTEGTVLRALSQGTASIYGKRVNVDLTKTPYLNWRWKIDNRLDGINERTKSGDDFSARIYLVKTLGLLGRKSKAVNYVWSSNQATGSTWGNAYQPRNSKMLAVRGTEDGTGQWVTEKRNVATDFVRLFDEKITTVDLVVIMSDSDNSGLTVSASYGDIFFSEQ